MTTQLIVGEVRYAPSRDVVYIWPEMLKTIAQRLEEAPYAPLHAWLSTAGVTLEDLGEAAGAYARFMVSAHQDPKKGLWQCLEEAGWNKCRWEAQVAYWFYASAYMTGVFWHGIRAATPEGGETIPAVEVLVHAASRFGRYATLPRWKQWLCRHWGWYRRRLLGDDKPPPQVVL